jgi:hypothetical protein
MADIVSNCMKRLWVSSVLGILSSWWCTVPPYSDNTMRFPTRFNPVTTLTPQQQWKCCVSFARSCACRSLKIHSEHLSTFDNHNVVPRRLWSFRREQLLRLHEKNKSCHTAFIEISIPVTVLKNVSSLTSILASQSIASRWKTGDGMITLNQFKSICCISDIKI